MGQVIKRQHGSRNIFLAFLVLALGVSLGVHLVFLKTAEKWVIVGFSPANYDVIVPRTFKMKRVELDPKTLEEPKKEEKPPAKIQPITMPKEEPGPSTQTKKTEDNYLSKPIPLPQEDILPEMKGGGDQAGLVAAMTGIPRSVAELELPTTSATIFSTKDISGTAAGEKRADERQTFSSLDDLLAGSNAVSEKTAPILMPTDLLFGYDSDVLRPEAEQTLEKLGTLIKKNGQADFRIEGHTDSFGTEQYNDALSLRRAEAVKTWLQERMKIGEGRITTVGLGKRHLLAPSSGTVQQQQLNRRVEIVITKHPGT
jgi:outer membrane protein OmpA-like peptidoglycan-associated protein